MTLIAFSTGPDHADVVTDTWCYTQGGRRIDERAKLDVVGRGRVAVLAAGSSTFGDQWRLLAAEIAARSPTFDVFADAAGYALRRLWDDYVTACRDHGWTPHDSTAFAVGFSPARGRYTAYAWDTLLALERMTVDGLYVGPASSGRALGTFERLRLEQMGAGTATLDRWSSFEPFPTPQTDDDWRTLADEVRRTRTLATTPLHVFVGGDLVRARLRPDSTAVDVIHRFPDDDFAQVVAGTLHPEGQAGPCPRCDSGRRYIDCHLTNLNTKPCPCGSSATFDGCCSIYATS